MALVTTKKMLLDAQAGGYAVGAFNVENMEMIQAVLAAAEQLGAPVIMQTTPSTIKYASADYFYGNAFAAAKDAKVPAALHLDHGSDYGLAVRALRAGYTSIMIDGAKLPLEDNIEITRKVTEMCSSAGIPVEAELGKVGGKEDDLQAGPGDAYTDPEEAAFFVKQTGISSLAVAIGTAHGFYQGEPRLDLQRLSEIRQKVTVPLVLHGASGVPDETVKESIRRGICKVNYATELRAAYTGGAKETITQRPEVIDPKAFGKAGRERVMELVIEKMKVCGCAGKEF